MGKKLFITALYTLLCAMILSFAPAVVQAETFDYPALSFTQDDNGTFVKMNDKIIFELEGNRYMRFRATDADDNWVGCERKGADLCIAFADNGVKGITISNYSYEENKEEGWFRVDVEGEKDGLDAKVSYSILATWLPEIGKFKYTYETAMDADLEKWYANSVTASGYYKNNPNAKAPIEITDYHIEHIATTDIVQSETYQDMPLRYEWFLASDDGSAWEKFPKVHLPYPTRTGDYITIRERGSRLGSGAKFGFTDKEHGGWMSTVNRTSVDGINFELCWYFFDVHILMYNAVPPRYSAERFTLDFSIDFDPLSKEEGNELVQKATERNWREYEEYALPLFTRNNTFDTLITDIDSEHTCEHHLWWASSFDCFRDDTVGYDDNYSVSIKRDKEIIQPAAWNTFGWGYPFEDVNIKKHKFRLSAMVKTKDVTGKTRLAYAAQKSGADLYYGVDTHLADGTPREDIIIWKFSDGLTGTNDWTELSMEFEVSGTVTGVINSIVLEQSGAGQSWFDNVVIEDLGEVTADSYIVYDDFEDGKTSDWTANSNGTIYNENGKLIVDAGDEVITGDLYGNKSVYNYGGKWVAEIETTINTLRGAILASANVFNIEINGKSLLIKTSDKDFATVQTIFDRNYQQGTPIKLKVVIDFDTKAIELYYNGERVDMGEGNYIRKESISTLQTFVVIVNRNYTGNMAIDKFMLYPATDVGAVNITREALKLDKTALLKNDITLPTEGMNGSSISWSSSDNSVVTDNGSITRGDNIKYATLTATVTKGDAKTTKTFNVSTAPYEGFEYKVTSMSTDAGETTAKISVQNDTAVEYENMKAILACYSGEELIGIDMVDVDADMTKKSFDLEAAHEGSADLINVYLWTMEDIIPVAEVVSYKITAIPVIDFAKSMVNIGEIVGFDVFEKKGNATSELNNGDYTLTCEGMTVDYDLKTVSFADAGLKTVTITTKSGVSSAKILVNDPSDTVSVKGSNVFTSDFTKSDSLATYYGSAHSPLKYTIEDVDGTKMLATRNASDTLLTNRFGPELTDYVVEMEYNMVRPIASGWNGIVLGLRAKSNNDAYRVGYVERAKYDGTNLVYDRVALGRGASSNLGNLYYADYSDSALGVARDTFYKLRASICGNTIKATLYDMAGNVITDETVKTTDCDYTKAGASTSAISSGMTQIGYHGLYARIRDIKIFDYNKVGEINVTASSNNVAIGEAITLNAFAGDVELNNVKYTALSGFEVKGNTATATEAGKHLILAEYTDDAGKTKSAVVLVTVE